MKHFVHFLFLIFACRWNTTIYRVSAEKNFELEIEQYIHECKGEIYQVGSSESLENFDEYVTKCIMSCMYSKLGLISNGQLDLENVRMYLASMIKYLSDKHNFVYDEENNEIGISCAEEVQEAEDVCELVSSFEQCWYQKLIAYIEEQQTPECIENEENE